MSIKKGVVRDLLSGTFDEKRTQYDEIFLDKLQMIFDEYDRMDNETRMDNDRMDVESSSTDEDKHGTYRVDTNFLVKSLADSVHDMFDPERSSIQRSLTSFQDLLLARFASSFQKNNHGYNSDLCYKILQIYMSCIRSDKIDFFDTDGTTMKTNLAKETIAGVIFNTKLLDLGITSVDAVDDQQFWVGGNIIEYQHNTKNRDNIVANLLLHKRYLNQSRSGHSSSDKPNLHGITENAAIKLIYEQYRGTDLESVFEDLFDLYSGDGLIQLIEKTIDYNTDDTNALEKKAQLLNVDGKGGTSVPSVNSCFPHIELKARRVNENNTSDTTTSDTTTFDIRKVVETHDNNFKFINKENTSMLVGDGIPIFVADYDDSTELVRNLAKNHSNSVVISRVSATRLDEAPDGFSKTITHLNATTNLNTYYSSYFQGGNDQGGNDLGENEITFVDHVNGQKLYSYKVVENTTQKNTNILINIKTSIRRGDVEEIMRNLGQIEVSAKIYEKIFNRMGVKNFPLFDDNLSEIPIVDRLYKERVKHVLKSDFQNTCNFIEQIVSDELNQCYLEIKLYNNPFVNDEPTKIEKISVRNMSSQINQIMNNNKENALKTREQKVEYIKNLIEIDMLQQGKESGDMFPTLSTLKIVNHLKSEELYKNLPSSSKITSTVITSADKNAILNLMSLARLNPINFDKAIIIFNHGIDSDENSTAVRIGNNNDIFNEHGNGLLESLPRFFKLDRILKENQRIIVEDNTIPTLVSSSQTTTTTPTNKFVPILPESQFSVYSPLADTNTNNNANQGSNNSPLVRTGLNFAMEGNSTSDKRRKRRVSEEVPKNTFPQLGVVGKKIYPKYPNTRSQTTLSRQYKHEDQRVPRSGDRITYDKETPGGFSTKKIPKFPSGTLIEVTNHGTFIIMLDGGNKLIEVNPEDVSFTSNGGSRKNLHKKTKKVTRRKNKKSPKRKTIKKRKMPKRKNKTRRNK